MNKQDDNCTTCGISPAVLSDWELRHGCLDSQIKLKRRVIDDMRSERDALKRRVAELEAEKESLKNDSCADQLEANSQILELESEVHQSKVEADKFKARAVDLDEHMEDLKDAARGMLHASGNELRERDAGEVMERLLSKPSTPKGDEKAAAGIHCTMCGRVVVYVSDYLTKYYSFDQQCPTCAHIKRKLAPVCTTQEVDCND